MSVTTTGPPGTATTASSESAGALPPDAVAATTDWPRARPFKTPPGENEATKGFLLANVTAGFGIVLPSASFTTTSMLGCPPTSKISGFGPMTNEVGPVAMRKVAPTLRTLDIRTMQPPVPVQSRLQPPNTQPDAGVGVNVTAVPNRKVVPHSPLFPLVHLIPAGDEVIVPLPAIDTVSSGANATEQFRFWVITSVAAPPLPAQSPPQPAIEKAHPGAVLGESVTEAPLKNLAEHMPLLAAAQLMPTGADVTVPPPRTETVSMKKSCTAASTSTWKVKNPTVLGTLHCTSCRR